MFFNNGKKKLSFFHRDPPSHDEYIKMERKGDADRRKKLLDEQGKTEYTGTDKQINDAEAGQLHTPNDVVKSKKSFKDKITEYQINRKVKREASELRDYKRRLDKEEHTEKGIHKEEAKIFGRELSDDERADFQKFKIQKREEKKQKRENIKKGYENFRKNAAKFNGNLKNTQNVVPFGNSSLLDFNVASPKAQELAQGANMLDMNFGRMLAGRKPKKVKKKNGLSLNVLDG